MFYSCFESQKTHSYINPVMRKSVPCICKQKQCKLVVQYRRLMATLLFTIYIVLILVPIEKPMLQKLTLP